MVAHSPNQTLPILSVGPLERVIAGASVDPPVLPLDAIMQRYARGEAAAFGELYRALAPRLHRFCMRLSRRRSEADDVFQDALLRLHRARVLD
jgi:hypothetical protein